MAWFECAQAQLNWATQNGTGWAHHGSRWPFTLEKLQRLCLSQIDSAEWRIQGRAPLADTLVPHWSPLLYRALTAQGRRGEQSRGRQQYTLSMRYGFSHSGWADSYVPKAVFHPYSACLLLTAAAVTPGLWHDVWLMGGHCGIIIMVLVFRKSLCQMLDVVMEPAIMTWVLGIFWSCLPVQCGNCGYWIAVCLFLPLPYTEKLYPKSHNVCPK